MHVCMCTRGMPGSLESQKRPLDPLEQEFRMVLNYQAGAGNWACTVCENSNCSYLLSYYSSPLAGFLLLLCMYINVAPTTILRSQFSSSPAGSGDWLQVVRLAQHAPLPTEPHCPSLVTFLASSGDFSLCYLSLSQDRGRKRLKVNQVLHPPVQVLSSTKQEFVMRKGWCFQMRCVVFL